jgi:4-hydroxy-3-methylbut-2-enyl diphosphate reductase
MGFCWGVRRALDIVRAAAETREPIAALGDIIHNPQVVRELQDEGIEPTPSIEAAVAQGFQRVAITAHGAGPSLRRRAETLGVAVVDTTCPLVTKVQRLAVRLVREGYYLVIYGNADHPEVRGILDWAATTRATVASHPEELPWTVPRGDPAGIAPPRKVAVISQTTKQTEQFLAFATLVASKVLPHGGEVRVVNTICQPTWERQEAIRALAREVDVVLVVGGRKSSNTARLVEVARSCGVASYQVEASHEIRGEWLDGADVVGISAGASTPDHAVLEVVRVLVDRGFEPPATLWRADEPDLDEFAEL